MKKIRFGKVSMVDGIVKLEFKEVETDDTLQLCYSEIGCECIDIPYVSRAYDEKGISVVLDDNGKLVDEESQVITGLIIDFADEDRPEVIDYIVGNYLLISYDEEGETVSLTDEQVENIKDSFMVFPTHKGLLSILPF